MSTAEMNMDGSREIGAQLHPAEIRQDPEESYSRLVMRRFAKHKLAVAGLAVMTVLVLMAVFAPFIARHDPYQVTGSFEAEPSWEYWLGTDQTGRDVLSRLIYAARVSLTVGIGSVVISVAIGTVLGLVSGFFGGWVDMVVMRITDVFMSFPQLMLILVVVSMVGPSLTNVILVLGLLGWTGVARLVRGGVLSVKQLDFVKAGVALGLGVPRILFAHILPNVTAPILVHATFGIAGAILVEASLSFLGLGVQPPTASWGIC
ncbi:ABC transporter permease [Paenibacillus sp. P26]|nr:ABC transporter permease [Paenibacillus sp. P26]UUZ94764.1 ABC transporter permease [Paenibacillus sp. P25]